MQTMWHVLSVITIGIVKDADEFESMWNALPVSLRLRSAGHVRSH